jgi:hypothetical protein
MKIDREALAARLEANVVTGENRDERMQELRDQQVEKARAAREAAEAQQPAQPEIRLDGEDPVPRETSNNADKPADPAKSDDKPSERDKTSDFQKERKRRKEAEERAARAEAEARELRARLTPPAEDNPRPKKEQFGDDVDRFADAVAEWKLTEQRRQDALADQQRRVKERADELRGEYADFDDTLKAGAEIEVRPNALKALLDCGENIPDLQYYLIKHPEEMARINEFTELGAAREYGRILSRLEIERDKSVVEPPLEVTSKVTTLRSVSQAPKPISPLKGAKSAPSASLDANGEFTGSFQDYKAQRRAGLIK